MFDQPVNWVYREQKFFFESRIFFALFQNNLIFSQITYIFIKKTDIVVFPIFTLKVIQK
jgi:hypothetical protein